MNAILILLGLLYSQQNVAALLFEQSDKPNPYKITTERLEFVSVDSTMADGYYKLTRYNKTNSYVNASITFKEDCCTSDYEVQVATYKLVNNEYLATGKIKRPVCEFLPNEYANILYPSAVKPGNTFLPASCPIKKGTYTFYDGNPQDNSGADKYNFRFKKGKLEIVLLKSNKTQFIMNGYYSQDSDAAAEKNFNNSVIEK